MKKVYQELCLNIIHFNLDVLTSSGGTIVDDTAGFNKGWLDD